MIVCRNIPEIRERLKGVETGLVPTMGALHEGHLALIREAKARAGHCTVTIFVNPTQFGPNEDYSKYPRKETEDFELAKAAGADVIFAPSVQELYQDSTYKVDPGPIADIFEGAIRPGHFAGVCLVVLKLFNIVQPTLAVFGRKDLQQCSVVSELVRQFNVPIQLIFAETVREPSGLAMSSRNAYLSPADRQHAAKFPETLKSCCEDLQHGSVTESALERAKSRLESFGFVVDYLALVDEADLSQTLHASPTSRIVSAIRFSGIRLLDNMPIFPQTGD